MQTDNHNVDNLPVVSPEYGEQDHQPSQRDRVLSYFAVLGRGSHINSVELDALYQYLMLLERQARKAKHQRRTLRDLHRRYNAALMENRFLATLIGKHRLRREAKDLSKYTLWASFKKLIKVRPIVVTSRLTEEALAAHATNTAPIVHT